MKPLNIIHLSVLLGITVATLLWSGCNKKGSEDSSKSQSYSFSSPSNGRIQVINNSVLLTNTEKQTRILRTHSAIPIQARSSTGPTLCSSVVCITPTAISGKYYGTGLLIQSQGKGMMAYFGQESWSNIIGTSESYNFDLATPVTNSGTLTCCTGAGDLANGNSYLESVAYLFSYLDVTFAVTGITGNTSMNGTYTIRFVLADGAITEGLRGDVLINDSGTFKWMNSDNSTLSSTRPANPVMMDSSVSNWTNPFGADQGNQNIPVLYANVIPSTGGTMMMISESDLRTTNKTYSFGFNPQNFIIFPTVLNSDLNLISSMKELMSRVHLGGLPHSAQPMGIGNPADTVLTISN